MQQQPAADLPIHGEVFSSDDFKSSCARLAGSRCGKCDEVFFPKRLACPRCHSPKFMSHEELRAEGRIFALTHVAKPAALYSSPYLLALVDLENGPRILAQVKGDPQRVRIGELVRLAIEPLFDTRDGRHVWGYRFEATGRM